MTPRGRRRSSSPNRPRSMRSETAVTAASGVSAFEGAASEGSRSVRGGGGASRRWSMPWGKRVRLSGGGGTGGGTGGGNSLGDGNTLYEERTETAGGQAGGGGSSSLSSLALPPRLRSNGRSGKRRNRRRVRWGRVFGASVALMCALAMLAAAALAYFFPGDRLEGSPLPLAPLWQGASGLGLFLPWQGEEGGGMMPGVRMKMATAWRSRLERFSFGRGGGADEVEDEDEDDGGEDAG